MENRIICGDSVSELEKMESNFVDCVITSPPYNFKMEYDKHNDKMDWNEYIKLLSDVFDECGRVLKENGRMFINIIPNFKVGVPTHAIIIERIQKQTNSLNWRGTIIWDKNGRNSGTAWGSWMSPSAPYGSQTWEYIEIFSKGDWKKSGKAKDIDIEREEFLKWVNFNWRIPTERRMKKFGHPAMFPEELPRRIIKLFTYKNDIILDPFNGVGTTTYVASKLGRRYIGIDISEEYCKTARQRLAGEFEKKITGTLDWL